VRLNLQASSGFLPMLCVNRRYEREGLSVMFKMAMSEQALPILVRPSREEDTEMMMTIYRHHIRYGVELSAVAASDPLDSDDLKRRRKNMKNHRLPHLVAEVNGMVIAYAYAVPFRKRPAYRYTLKHSIYVHHEHLRCGVGRLLLPALIDACAAAGYRQMIGYIDAANVDLKGFTEKFYHKLTVSHLADVLDTLFWLKHETNVWFEITTLLIPGENDSPEEIKNECDWILNNLGDSVPLHFTAFHPDFKMLNKERTSENTLIMARNIAIDEGIKFCYVGNVHNIEGQTTYCPNCIAKLITRDWHSVRSNRLNGGNCPECGTQIPGVFN